MRRLPTARPKKRPVQKEEIMKKLLVVLFAWILSYGIAFAVVNINTATEAELQTLKGIGPTRAKAIVDYRTKHGPFKTVDDLEKVPGIGPATMKQIRSDVAVSGPTTTEKAGTKTKTDDSAKKTSDEKKKSEKKTDTKEAKKSDTTKTEKKP